MEKRVLCTDNSVNSHAAINEMSEKCSIIDYIYQQYTVVFFSQERHWRHCTWHSVHTKTMIETERRKWRNATLSRAMCSECKYVCKPKPWNEHSSHSSSSFLTDANVSIAWYCNQTTPCITEQFDKADESLFKKLSCRLLHHIHILPANKSQRYKLNQALNSQFHP